MASTSAGVSDGEVEEQLSESQEVEGHVESDIQPAPLKDDLFVRYEVLVQEEALEHGGVLHFLDEQEEFFAHDSLLPQAPVAGASLTPRSSFS